MFYVYEWFIVDTLEVFYVGKGTGNRRFELHNRNKYFNNVYKKYNCAVRVIESYLTNEQACELERERIAELWSIGQAKCNLTEGGKGFSTGDLNPNRINPPTGERNPMYGVRFIGSSNHFYGKTHSEETRKKISESRKGKGGLRGKDNPMYGKGFKGENNPMFGRVRDKHPNSKAYKVTFTDGRTETMYSKECEETFGIAFTRIRHTGGILHYKKQTDNAKYEGTNIEIVEPVTTIPKGSTPKRAETGDSANSR